MNAMQLIVNRMEEQIEAIKQQMKNPYYRGITFKMLHAIEHEIELITEQAYFTDESYWEALSKLEGIEAVLDIIKEGK